MSKYIIKTYYKLGIINLLHILRDEAFRSNDFITFPNLGFLKIYILLLRYYHVVNPVIDQYLLLTIIGIIIFVAGIVLLVGKVKGGFLVLLIGFLWLLTMGIYYAFTYTGVYKSGLYPVANVIGVVLLVVGLGAVLYYWMRAGVLRR